MGKLLLVTGLALVAAAPAAHAGPAAFCGGKTTTAGHEELTMLRTHQGNPGDELERVWELSCSTDPEAMQHRGDIDQARAAWSQKLGMTDADWIDAAGLKDQRNQLDIDLSGKDLTALGPIDQYAAIKEGFGDRYHIVDAMYATDVFEQRLTETGRMAFVQWCLKNDSVANKVGDVPKWAVCWPDIAKFDAGKALAEIKADSHPGFVKMRLRVEAANLPDEIKQLTDRKNDAIKADETWKKMFDVAAQARDQWQKDVGGDKALLELAIAMDAGAFFHSRKLLDGCTKPTTAALASAVSTMPSKAFTGMHDDHDMVKKGFAEQSGPRLVNVPVVNVAATAWAECHGDDSTVADFLRANLDHVPGARGPRNAALGAIMGEQWQFDDTRAAKPEFPRWENRPTKRSGGTIVSEGGVVKSIKPKADKKLVVESEKTFMMQEDCVKEHTTNRLSRIRPDGSFEYELICDKTALVKHDTSYSPFTITPAMEVEKVLKPGVLFSEISHNGRTEIIAIWPSKTAQTPSWVLGGTVK